MRPITAFLRPAPRTAILAEPGYHVWCGSIAGGEDGLYSMFYSRWPREAGFDAWVTHSAIHRATAPSPLGPWTPRGAVFELSEILWDASVTHNPTVLRGRDAFYLYYTGNCGNGWDWRQHRNAQRIGVAQADNLAGPWRRMDRPLIDTDPSSWDALITSNPAVCLRPDGGLLMIYKTVSPGPMPFGGRVLHAVAAAEHPIGPFQRNDLPIFTHPHAAFPAEDPCVWYEPDAQCYRAIIKDMGGYFTGTSAPCLAEFWSPNGSDWQSTAHPLVSGLEVRWDDGAVTPVKRLERPQVLLDDRGRAIALSCAVLPQEESCAYNVTFPLER